MGAEPIKVKGAAILGYLQAVENLFGATTREALVDRAAPEFVRTVRSNALVRAGWYPIAWYRSFYEAAAVVLPSERTLATKLGRETARIDSDGPLLRWFMRLAGPDLLARHIPRALDGYFLGPTFSSQPSHGGIRILCRGMVGFNRPQWDELLASSVFVLETASRRSVSGVLASADAGADADLLIWWNAEAAVANEARQP
jgi:hypothetical protein